MRRYTIVSIVLIALFATGCANRTKEAPERTEAEHYTEAKRQIGKKNYLTAIDELRELEARYPYGDYTEQAQLDLIYTQFRAADYPAVVATATRFQRNHPNHQHLDYVLYMQGLANYSLEKGMMDGVFGPDKSSRDLRAWICRARTHHPSCLFLKSNWHDGWCVRARQILSRPARLARCFPRF